MDFRENLVILLHNIMIVHIESTTIIMRVYKIILLAAGAFFDSMLMPYEVTTTSTGVCVSCTFMDTSSTDCVAVVHQRISQLNSSGLMTIESSHKFTRSGDTASGCIEGVNLEDFQVGAFIITKGIFTGVKKRGKSRDGGAKRMHTRM